LQEAGLSNIVHCLPGANPRLFFPDTHVPLDAAFPFSTAERLSRGFDVSFVGSWTPGREAALQDIHAAGIDLAIFGDAGWGRSPLVGLYGGSVNYLSELNTVYNASRINLDLPHEASLLPDYVSFRVHDCLASGNFLLAHQRPGLEHLWEEGAELAGSYESGMLVDALREHLAEPLNCRAVAVRGRETVLGQHTWQNRLRTDILPQLEMRLLKTAAAA
jgi:spore maturation protein CgeB